MKVLFSFLTPLILLMLLISCNKSKKQKELQLKNSELNMTQAETTKNSLSTKDAVKLAEKQFSLYLPKILKSHDAILDVQQSYTGDFTGDKIEDVAIYFSLAPNEGGNAIVGQGVSLYQNDGLTVKVIAGYDPDYLFRFNKISNGKIYVEKLEYSENDARCCPSIKTEHVLTISGSIAF